jgi:serine/threonine protein kinase
MADVRFFFPSFRRPSASASVKASSDPSGKMVAIKRIKLEGMKEADISKTMAEVDLLKRLTHPSVVKYEGMMRDEETLHIVLECALLFLLWLSKIPLS